MAMMENIEKSKFRRSFTKEFKVDAVSMVLDEERSVADVARSLDVGAQTLGNWVRGGRRNGTKRVARLQGSARQNQLTQAIQEYGRIVKTISIMRYLHNQDHRRRIHDQLNKGESLHALRRHLFFANLGRRQRRRPDDQDLQAQCLTLITNAIVCWNTVYLDAAIDHHQATGLPLSESAVRQFSPTIHEHINVYGRYDFIAPSSPPEGQLRPLQI